jgi:hypothetical protein
MRRCHERSIVKKTCAPKYASKEFKTDQTRMSSRRGWSAVARVEMVRFGYSNGIRGDSHHAPRSPISFCLMSADFRLTRIVRTGNGSRILLS